MRRNWVLALAVLVALFGLIRGLNAGALWDPHEVAVAELGRRLAVNLWGAHGLAVAGADNSVPIRADLGRGELPFTSAALGFRLAGLSAWAGRLPLLLWALAGLGALYGALAELWARRVALYGVLVLATTPLYFLQARTLLGDAVTLACFALAWSGLAVACLADETTLRRRVAYLLLGLLGLYAGFWCRGPIVSVALPALSVGVPALLLTRGTGWGRWGGAALTLVGVASLGVGIAALRLSAQTAEYSVFVGSQLRSPAALPTFDVPLGQLAHALFPWSAAVPLVLFALFGRESSRAGRGAAVVSAALAVGLGACAVGWLSASVGALALPSVACFAVLVAAALAELEASAAESPLLGLVVAAAALVTGFDLHEHPEKSLSGFELPNLSLPESLQETASAVWLGGAAVLALVALLSLYERGDGPRFQRSEYRSVLQTLQRTWDGNLLFALLLLETMLVGFLLLSAISERLVAIPQLDGFGSFWRRLVALGAMLVPLLPLLPLGAMLLRDLLRGVRARVPLLLLAFASVGLVASVGLYPALAAQVSPKEAFERYRSLRHGTEPLGVLGEQSGAARYQGAPDAVALENLDTAFAWLTAGEHERRWLVLKSSALAELNARFRLRSSRNLPVLDARSSEVLLASSRLEPGERDESPLAPSVLSAPPPIEHPLHAVLDHKLEVLGWRVLSPSGAPQSSVTPGERYRFVIYFRVLAPLRGSWQTFVHLDGLQRRFNADHEPLQGKYPPHLWAPGDVLADAADLELEPNFSPGPYRVYLGMFTGEQRLSVSEGPAAEDRIEAGTLQVR